MKLKIFYVISAFNLVAFSFYLSSFTKTTKFDIIRVKGIVIEDANGKDQILIGAPVPNSKDRIRTDTVKVRKYMANKVYDDVDQYMKWYKDYKHSANGIVFMNEEGFDRVLVGENLADPNVGVRMFENSGILWNDKFGMEKGGAGVNTNDDGKSRPSIGLDDDSGEAVHLVCLEDGSKALIISDSRGSIRIGMSKNSGELFQNNEAFTGIKYFNNEGKLVWEQKM